MANLLVELYCDSTDLYTEEEMDADNICILLFPEWIVREYYRQKVKSSADSFEEWFISGETLDALDGLYTFAKQLGFQATR